jgi:flagellar basal-body rod modification protein FlgD
MESAASTMPAAVTTLPMGSQAPSASGSSQILNQSDFLQLMTAQLKDQDPLNPMTGTEFAAELAQFSTAQGVQSLQTSMSGVGTTLSGMQATGLVGQNVAVSGNTLSLGANGIALGALNLSSAASDVTVTINNTSGTPVATLNLGALPGGTQSFVWNGAGTSGSQAPSGTYSFSVNAVGATGGSVTATPYAVAPITAVTFGGQSGPMLELGGGLAPVALSAVQQVF